MCDCSNTARLCLPELLCLLWKAATDSQDHQKPSTCHAAKPQRFGRTGRTDRLIVPPIICQELFQTSCPFSGDLFLLICMYILFMYLILQPWLTDLIGLHEFEWNGVKSQTDVNSVCCPVGCCCSSWQPAAAHAPLFPNNVIVGSISKHSELSLWLHLYYIFFRSFVIDWEANWCKCLL